MSEPLQVGIAGKSLTCKHCGADEFFEKSATLDRLALGGLLHLEGWLGNHATIYVCSRCGFLHWFFAVESATHSRSESTECVECLSCGQPIPDGAESCPACGWSWESGEAEPT